MMQEKSKWVEEVLDSTQGIAPAHPRTDLYGQLKARLGKEMPKVRLISLEVMSAAAACLLGLFALNIRAVNKYAAHQSKEVQGGDASVTDIIDYYELGSNNTGL